MSTSSIRDTTASSSSSTVTSPYPPIIKGASLLIAYRLENRPVLLIGGGAVAAGRLFFLLESGAHVTLVSPRSGLDPSILYRIETSNTSDITYHDRYFLGRSDPLNVSDYAMVLTAIDDNPLSYEVYESCRDERVTVNVADVPPKCDFYFGAQLRQGPLQIMISTGGMGPKIGAMVRDIVRKAIPDNIQEAIQGVGALRTDLRKRAPGVGGDLGKKRMEWMIGICDKWGLGDMAILSKDDIRTKVLDQGWDKGKVVGPSDVGVGGKPKSSDGLVSLLGGGQVVAGASGLLGGLAIGIVGTLIYLRHAR
ncbi:putative NAD(P)-binding-domain-containing protein [Naematelia encephala]|uniref:precorrin-2 dehydrogenase n=1 Tax=Naematelia encephala TaxID=71784 RepID=A0A1Y2BEX5_9TREE|nr:putative NAD(P)-binding-domain-containing protein [Naematelia encephala]